VEGAGPTTGPSRVPPPARSRPAALALGAVLVLALGLRLADFGWGIPLEPFGGYYHPDEGKVVQGALDFPADVAARTDLRYPTGYHYAIGLVRVPLAPVVATLRPGTDRVLGAYVVGRGLTVLLAVLAVLATFLFGRRLFGARAGLVAAALLAVSAVHVLHSAFATLDVPTSLLALVALWRADVVFAAPSRRNVLLLAVASGLLIGVKWPGAAILVPGVLAIVLGRRAAGAGWQAALVGALPDAALYLAVTAAVVLATTPAILLRPGQLVEAVTYETGRQGLGEMDRLDPETWLDVADALQVAVGAPLAWLLLAGLALAFVRPTAREILLVALVGGYVFVLGDRAANRYLILPLPVLCLFAGRMVSRLAADRRAAVRWATVALAAVAWLAGLRFAATAVAARRAPDARMAAAAWLAANAPAGSTVCLDQANEADPQDWKEPQVSRERFAVVDCLERPEYVLGIGGGHERLRAAFASPHLRPDYTWDPEAADFWPDDRPPSPDRLRFYEDLLVGPDPSRAYDLAVEFTNEKLPTVPFEVSGVRVFRHRSAER